ncbi:hypothetical protein ACKVMT_01340 [Halobacteriales archaeon Cl-PHB]
MTMVGRRLMVAFLVLGLVAPAGLGSAAAEVDTVTSVDVTAVAGDGDQTLEVSVTADTSLDDTDITGQDPGEPYFVFLVDGTAIGRTAQVERSESYVNTFTVSDESLSGLSAGSHTLTVQLWDKDSDDFDPTTSGDDDFLSERSGTFSLDEAADLTLTASRSQVPTGGTISVNAAGDTGGELEWQLAQAPSESDATLRAHNGQTVTVRPDEPGTYTIEARAPSTGASGQVTVSTSGTSQLSLLRRYAPRLHYDRAERYRPTRYEAFVKHAALEDFGQSNTERPTMFDLAGRSDDWELDLHGEEADFPRYDDGYPPTVYGSIHEGVSFRGERYTAVTYWLFYIYDPKDPEGISQLFAHQSDLESVTILLQDGEPKWVGASQHHGGELREWAKTPKSGTHIELYPAVGAHSNYLRNTENYGGEGIPGQNQFAFADSLATTLLDVGYADQTGDDRLLTVSAAGDSRYEVVPLTGDEVWATYNGAFGPSDNEGKVPMARERWAQPGAWLEAHLPPDEAQVGGTISTAAIDQVADGQLTADVRLTNPGPKPHTLVAILETKPVTAAWEDAGEVVTTERVPLGVDQTASVTLQGTPAGDVERFDARVRLAAYRPTILDAGDVLASEVAGETFVRATSGPTATPTERDGGPAATPTASPGDGTIGEPTETDDLVDATPGASGPGFGLVAVLQAVVLLLVGVSRRDGE